MIISFLTNNSEQNQAVLEIISAADPKFSQVIAKASLVNQIFGKAFIQLLPTSKEKLLKTIFSCVEILKCMFCVRVNFRLSKDSVVTNCVPRYDIFTSTQPGMLAHKQKPFAT